MLNWRGKRPFTSTQYYPAQLKEVHGEEVDGFHLLAVAPRAPMDPLTFV